MQGSIHNCQQVIPLLIIYTLCAEKLISRYGFGERRPRHTCHSEVTSITSPSYWADRSGRSIYETVLWKMAHLAWYQSHLKSSSPLRYCVSLKQNVLSARHPYPKPSQHSMTLISSPTQPFNTEISHPYAYAIPFDQTGISHPSLSPPLPFSFPFLRDIAQQLYQSH